MHIFFVDFKDLRAIIKAKIHTRQFNVNYYSNYLSMIITYGDCIAKYGSDYKLKKEIESGRLFQLEKGFYSDSRYHSDKELISVKYPKAVFSGGSAFYYHGLTDVIPDNYTLATKREDTRIKANNIKQLFIRDDLFDIGIESMDSDGITIRIYNLERMLIELIRLRSKYPMDYYKEIIGNYRNRIFNMDFARLEEYASKFSYGESIMDIIQLEVL